MSVLLFGLTGTKQCFDLFFFQSKVPHSVHSALSESYLAVALSVLLHDAFNVSSWKMNFLRLANGLWQP